MLYSKRTTLPVVKDALLVCQVIIIITLLLATFILFSTLCFIKLTVQTLLFLVSLGTSEGAFIRPRHDNVSP